MSMFVNPLEILLTAANFLAPHRDRYYFSMATIYLSMTDALIKHWKANGNAYPKKFILTPAQHHEYVESRRKGIGGHNVDGGIHMGVPVEIAEGTPGVMINADGSEVSLQS